MIRALIILQNKWRYPILHAMHINHMMNRMKQCDWANFFPFVVVLPRWEQIGIMDYSGWANEQLRSSWFELIRPPYCIIIILKYKVCMSYTTTWGYRRETWMISQSWGSQYNDSIWNNWNTQKMRLSLTLHICFFVHVVDRLLCSAVLPVV
jgi:hypothetical protein